MAHYGAVLQRSPGPLTVVGYYYPDGEFSRREEKYQVLTTQAEYDSVIKRIKRYGGSNEQKDTKLFNAFVPKLLDDEHVMTAEEAAALSKDAPRNLPKIEVKFLPPCA